MERTLAYEASAWVEKRRESFAYDDFARLSTVTHADGATAAYTYDPAGQVASVRDENHLTANMTYGYDPAGRLERVVQTLAESGVVTTYGYDVNGNLSGVMDPNGNLTSYLFDDFGQMSSQQSPVTGTTNYEYDDAGNILATTDANGARTERTWDALNRISTSASTLGGTSEMVTWSYDDSTADRFAVGRLSSMSDPAGTTAYHYERRGLLRKEARNFVSPTPAYSYSTAYQYDFDGNRSLISYPSTQLNVSYGHDYAGRPVTASGVITAAQYLPFGPLKQLAFANDTTQTFTYDNRYRMTANSLSGPSGTIATYAYHYDAAGNITRIEDELEAGYDRSFAYDELNRLTTASTGASLWGVDQYSWDAMGNLLKTVRGEVVPGEDDGLARVSPGDLQLKPDAQWIVTGRTTELAYDGTTPKIAAVTTNGIPRSVTYDAAGNETSWFATREYSPRNHLSKAVDDPEPEQSPRHTVEYAYDGRGIRVRRSERPSGEGSGTARRYFFYSPELRLLSVTRDDGANVWAMSAGDRDVNYEIVWFGDRPVAQVPTDSPRSYTFADHLGTPILQTDTSTAITWQAEYEPFGNVYEMRSGTRTAQPLRFPGQEVATSAEGFEENYNIFRWYRAGWGRYTQADPLGADVTERNVYRYSLSNPMIVTDRLGLEARICCRPLRDPLLARWDHCYLEIRENGRRHTWGMHRSVGFFTQAEGSVTRNNPTDTGGTCESWRPDLNCELGRCLDRAAQNYPSHPYSDLGAPLSHWLPWSRDARNSNTAVKCMAGKCGLSASQRVMGGAAGWFQSCPPGY